MLTELLNFLRLSVRAEIVRDANGQQADFAAGFRQGFLYAAAMAGATTEDLRQAILQGNAEAQDYLERSKE